MQNLCDRIRHIQEAIQAVAPKYPMPLIVSFDFAGTIREQCAFLKALISCSKTAEEEYGFVKDEVGHLEVIRDEISVLNERVVTVSLPVVAHDDGSVSDETEKGVEVLRGQLHAFARHLDESVVNINEKIEKLGEDLKSFKVVLFGRTKAGKSTVREALTQGAGETIGKGRQSTTTEVQWYDWQNLKVYDTPGILSMNDTNRNESGIGDEEVKALDLLQQSDVAIFMFASDNIEKAELDYLSDVVKRGKSALVLLNVKADLTDYKMFLLRHKNKTISIEAQSGHIRRIKDAIKDQEVTIIPVHAQAAFFSRAKNNEEVARFYERFGAAGATKSSLYDLSRFGEIRSYLAKNILTRGRAIRCQQIREYFINTVEKFATARAGDIENSIVSWRQLVEKTEASKSRVERKASQFAKSLRSKIEMAAKAHPDLDTYSIAYRAIDDGWSKDRISSEWRDALGRVMPKLPGSIVETFMQEIKEELEELMRDFDFVRDTYFSEGDTAYVLPWSDMFKVSGFVAGCLSLAVSIGWIPGGGWVAAGLAVVAAGLSFLAGLFKSKTTKIRELKEKLDAGLASCIDSVAESVRNKCEKELFPRITGQYNAMLKLQRNMLEMSTAFQSENMKILAVAERNKRLMEKRLKDIGG